MDDRQKVLNLIGLATKAGKTASGEFMTEKSVKSGKAFLVIVSEEASDNTRKMFTNMCTYYEVPIYFFGKKSEIGHGKGNESFPCHSGRGVRKSSRETIEYKWR